MDVTLMEKKCVECGTRLTQYEIEEKKGFCMDCSKEQAGQEKKK